MLPWLAAFSVFPVLILLHLRIAPFTKVEESFNLQAVHDILTYGIPTENVNTFLRAHYDHIAFPGVVPRTFIGALLLAAFSRPVIWLNNAVDRQQLGQWPSSPHHHLPDPISSLVHFFGLSLLMPFL